MGRDLYRSLSCGRFFAVFAALALVFAGCPGDDGGGGGSEAAVTTATFTGIESEEGSGTTTRLVLVFDRDIPGLRPEHVTINPVVPEGSENTDGTESPVSSEYAENPVVSETGALQAVAAENIGRADGRPGVYILALSGIDALEESLWLWPEDVFNGRLAVTVDADAVPGYRIAGPSHETDICVVPKRRAVDFTGAEAANSETRTKTTAELVLRIGDTDGLELEEGDVVLSGLDDANGAVATDGTPEKIGSGEWTIPVTGIAADGTVRVTLARNGYEFDPLSYDVPVCYAERVTLGVTAADGDELLAQRTTKLTLAFDKPVNSLDLNDITVADPNGTGAAKGSRLDPANGTNNYILTLANNSVTKSGMIGVTVAKGGYDVTSGTVQVAVYDNQYNYLATGGTTTTVTKDTGGVYYETHKFTVSDNFVFNGTASVSAQVLVVGGGGGAGGAYYPSSGAGAGGMVEKTAYALSKGTYAVTVGAGGTGGKGSESKTAQDGADGNPSSFGSGITAYGGKLSKGRGNTASQTAAVGTGGASGSGAGGTVYANSGGSTTTSGDYAAGGGGAGGQGSAGKTAIAGTENYAGAGQKSTITGGTYAMGGPTAPYANGTALAGSNGTANTGNGGSGAWNGKGGNGGSGIVVVRFPVSSAQ
jgi:hypothetical protein